MSDGLRVTRFKQIGNTFDKAQLFSLLAMKIEEFPIWTKAGSGDDLTFGMIPEPKLALVAMITEDTRPDRASHLHPKLALPGALGVNLQTLHHPAH